jgi:hypothetical protein
MKVSFWNKEFVRRPIRQFHQPYGAKCKCSGSHSLAMIGAVQFHQQKYAQLFYSVFQGFSYAKFAYGGSILSSSQFLILPQLPQKMKLMSKVVKIDPKIIVLLPTI